MNILQGSCTLPNPLPRVNFILTKPIRFTFITIVKTMKGKGTPKGISFYPVNTSYILFVGNITFCDGRPNRNAKCCFDVLCTDTRLKRAETQRFSLVVGCVYQLPKFTPGVQDVMARVITVYTQTTVVMWKGTRQEDHFSQADRSGCIRALRQPVEMHFNHFQRYPLID